jgi:hypothetical protein
MLKLLGQIVKRVIPESFKQMIRIIFLKVQIRQTTYYHQRALKKLKTKDKIKAVFLLIHNAGWKYEGLYRMMEKDERYIPVVVVCPFIIHGEDHMFRSMNQTFDSFFKSGYNVLKSFQENTGKWLDIKKELHPDMVFFTNPYNITRPEYLISNFQKFLTCYVPYGFKVSYLYEAHYNLPMQNLVWKFFLETDIHKKLSRQYSSNGSQNTLVTGYPGMDIFLSSNVNFIDVWKIKNKKLKRIIWAPHHSIYGKGGTLNYSTFLDFSDFMFDMADRYKDNIQIAFKPHPLLRVNLSKNDVWGKQKTDDYYNKWKDLSNGQLNEGEYLNLFFTSDGLIHDSGSFLIEYLYTKKPVMFLWNDDSIPERFNEVGKMALTKLYRGNNNTEIEKFICDIIIDGNDSLKDERISFFNKIIKPPNQVNASENIFNFLQSAIQKQ